MSMTDPIADFLARVRNGIRARKQEVELPRSTLKQRIAEILRDEGYLNAVVTQDSNVQGTIKVALRYDGRNSCAISGLRRVSRPGQRKYVPAKLVPRVRNGLGIAILSTSQGVMTDREARKRGVGGEVLCEVW
ncbi:MAG: 30S ribosomal protein S8 [Kofleriaceae bacterium]|nr:30S ribosomal protein S8 [Kofleriaceae bacterium]MBP6836730.1 30S ribosomal protein S8 [Kofleriaceae bacterium]